MKRGAIASAESISRENARDLKIAIDDIEEDMKELDEKISDKIQKALENPLANMRK